MENQHKSRMVFVSHPGLPNFTISFFLTMTKFFISVSLFLVCAQPVIAHPGRTNSEGCHGGKQPYHCHNSGKSSNSSQKSSSGYDRDNWSYNSSSARKRLGCDSTEHVDHVVALKEAYDSGASNWSSSKKKQFANDSANQMCLNAKTNMSKSDGDLAEWDGGSCSLRKRIAEITVEVKNKYNLEIDSAEQIAIENPCQ